MRGWGLGTRLVWTINKPHLPECIRSLTADSLCVDMQRKTMNTLRCSSESPAPSVEGPASHHNSWKVRGQRSRYTITSKICCFVYRHFVYFSFLYCGLNISWTWDLIVSLTPYIAYIKYTYLLTSLVPRLSPHFRSTLTRSIFPRSTQIFSRSAHMFLSQINKVNDKLY